MADPEPVLYETDDRVATLTLNRPERLNTITPELIEAFNAAMARAQDDPRRPRRSACAARAAPSAPATTSTGVRT